MFRKNKGFRYKKSLDTVDFYPQIFTHTKLSQMEANQNSMRLRYISIGIVGFHDVINDEKLHQKPRYVIYDNLTKTMLCFDVFDLYDMYIKAGIEDIETEHGTYRLSEKTISEITNIVFSDL